MSRRPRRSSRRDGAASRALTVAAALAAIVLTLVLLAGGCDLLDPARGRLRARIHSQLTGTTSQRHWFKRSRERSLVGNYDVAPLVVRFYERRGFRPAWCTGRGPRDVAFQLAAELGRAPAEGLALEDGHADSLRARLPSLESGPLGPHPDPRALADLDLLLTRSFFTHAAHLSTGLLDPARLPADWHVRPRRLDLVRVLEGALAAHDVAGACAAIAPSQEGYVRLLGLLRRYRAIAAAGGWAAVPPGPPLRLGARGARVRRLRERLAAAGDLEAGPSAGESFDAGLFRAVKRFQARHGLDTTGVVGPRDLAELAVSARARIRQIEVNLERWRWLPDTLGTRYLLVNIPAFTLEVRERGRPVLAMRVVVGRELSRTPLFSDSITYLVFNPVWEVPPDIAASEVLPAVQKDPEYLVKNHLRVFSGRGPQAREVDPASVDWRTVTPESFHFSIKQDPGPQNAVGHVKFMCPNQYAVYLHDTPAGQLFGTPERDLSHGCVRVEKPLELAEYLLAGKKGWDSLRVAMAFDTLRNQAVILPHPVSVHLLYWTAWVDDRGRAQFRRDVYGLDSLLVAVLSHSRGRPPATIAWGRIRPDSTSTEPLAPRGAAPRGSAPDAGRRSQERSRPAAARR